MGDLGRLLDIDHAHVWHPYAPMPASAPALLVSGANGVRLTLADGREVIDAMSSWWCAIHGYRHPALDGAASRTPGACVRPPNITCENDSSWARAAPSSAGWR